MKWRLIPFSEQSAALNMAIDESVMEHVREGKSPPTMRLYTWNPTAVTIGTFQCRADEVDLNEAKKLGVDVVRRMTGGGAVYHDRQGEITYSIIAPEELFERDIQESYMQICRFIVDALKGLGINAIFKPVNDIIVDSKKISGNAQTRRSGILVQHGTVLYDVDVDRMFSLLKVDKVKVSDKFVQSVKKAVTSVKQQNPGVTKQQVIDAMTKSFTAGKDFEMGKLSEYELERAAILAKEKYSSEEWNNCRLL
ncbi:MAG: biotin/lipoate A/B protein ligase family protein [Nanoarchaeota archaeon]